MQVFRSAPAETSTTAKVGGTVNRGRKLGIHISHSYPSVETRPCSPQWEKRGEEKKVKLWLMFPALLSMTMYMDIYITLYIYDCVYDYVCGLQVIIHFAFWNFLGRTGIGGRGRR